MSELFANATITTGMPDSPIAPTPGEDAELPGTEDQPDDAPSETDVEALTTPDVSGDEPPVRTSGRLQPRINELTAARHAAEARAAAAEARAAAAEARVQAQADTLPPVEPPSDAAQFRALIQAEVATHLQRQKAAEAQETQLEQLTQKYPDFETVVQQSTLEVSPVLTAAITGSPHRLELIYYLAQHPDETAMLNVASPLAIARDIRELGLTFTARPGSEASPPVPSSHAPPPLTPTRGNGTNSQNLDTMSFRDYVKVRNEQERKARQG